MEEITVNGSIQVKPCFNVDSQSYYQIVSQVYIDNELILTLFNRETGSFCELNVIELFDCDEILMQLNATSLRMLMSIWAEVEIRRELRSKDRANH